MSRVIVPVVRLGGPSALRNVFASAPQLALKNDCNRGREKTRTYSPIINIVAILSYSPFVSTDQELLSPFIILSG